MKYSLDFKKLFLTIFCLFFFSSLFLGQNVSISNNAATANNKAILDISSSTNNKGVLIPRMTTAEMNAITGTACQGLIIYNTTENLFYYNKSTTTTMVWVPLLSSSASSTTGTAGWSLIGNAGTTAGTNFIGTTDAQNLIIKTNNTERIRIGAGGNVGIGVSSNPSYQLTIGSTGAVFAVDNTATFFAKNSAGSYEAYLWPRWSDNAMYLNYGSAGLNIRNNSSSSALFIDNSKNVGIGKTSGMSEILDVVGNVKASGTVYWGNSSVRTETKHNAGDGTANAVKSGFYETWDPTGYSANWPAGANSWWHLLDVRHVHNDNYALQFAGSFFDQNIFFRKTSSSPSTAWTQLLATSDMPVYGNIRNTFANPGGGATTFYDDAVNFRISNGQFQFSSDVSGWWDIYGYIEESGGGVVPDTRANDYQSTGPTNWTSIGPSFGSGNATGPGATFLISKESGNTSSMYQVVILRHGTYYTTLVRKF